MFERLRPYFKTAEYQFGKFSEQQKERARVILDLHRHGLPKSAFGYVPITLPILNNFLLYGKFSGFPGNSAIEIPDLPQGEESIVYFPTRENVQADYLEIIPDYNPQKLAGEDAEVFAAVHYIVESLRLSLNDHELFKRVKDVVFPDKYDSRGTRESWNILTKTTSKERLLSLIEEAKKFKGLALAIDSGILNDSSLSVATEFDPWEDYITSSTGIPDEHLVGLVGFGDEENKFLDFLKKHMSK